MSKQRVLGTASAALLLALTACSPPTGQGQSPTANPPATVAAEPQAIAPPTTPASGPAAPPAASAPPVKAPAPMEETAAAPVAQPEVSVRSENGAGVPFTLYYIAVEDGGVSGAEIGCRDSLVATYTEPVKTQDQVQASIERLLADRDRLHGSSGLYNALHESALTFERARIDGDTVTVHLSGDLKSGGSCDDPRVEWQLRQTAATAAGVGEAIILVNGIRIEDYLSGRGPAVPEAPAPAAQAPITVPLTVYYIGLAGEETSGSGIGCGDSLVATLTQPVTFTDQLGASITHLLANRQEFLGESGLYNALNSSALSYQGSTQDGDTVIVNLSGSVTVGGTCDGPRIEAQLEQTAATAAGVADAVVLVNGIPIEKLVDVK
ncbi:GerMN domain-containing protein [Arthrobacter crystallopoietes]|nr:GerMN domain-containing protein [Arthrobacter crystallopoietes]